MVRHPGWLDPFGQRLDLTEVGLVKSIVAADRQRDTVHHHGIVAADAIEKMEGFAAINQIVLRNDLQPVHPLWRGDEIAVVVGTQTQAETFDHLAHGACLLSVGGFGGTTARRRSCLNLVST